MTVKCKQLGFEIDVTVQWCNLYLYGLEEIGGESKYRGSPNITTNQGIFSVKRTNILLVAAAINSLWTWCILWISDRLYLYFT